MPKTPKRPKKNGNSEVIHGRKVKTGKGVGKKVAKRATGAISARKRKMKELGLS